MKRENPEDVLKRNKLKLQIYCAVGLIIVGCVLLIFSFFVPPKGVIDSSVLAAIGEIFCFSGSLFGINVNYKLKLFKESAEFENKNSKNKEE